MPFHFWRRIRLVPGLTLNLSKSVASLSIGPQGAKYTISPRSNASVRAYSDFTVDPSRPAYKNAAIESCLLRWWLALPATSATFLCLAGTA
ncbi:MAG: DUF4236 domain-containing protein [Spiribacter salinus]|uniref:DUF4236 domain-containing protein n=1 Tax=Spiribacter salinus TaxID=1335746 RepID=A0A540VL69_9GAMM|nr:MAG: DUF4236 domain-containing protein [Spiribacter salinus]